VELPNLEKKLSQAEAEAEAEAEALSLAEGLSRAEALSLKFGVQVDVLALVEELSFVPAFCEYLS
jgi:hypothetical protein